MVVNKLKSNSGESIAEVLVTVLILSLATILFVNMVNAATRIIMRSEKSFKQYNNLKNAFEVGSTDDEDITLSINEHDTVKLSYGVNSNVYINVNPAKSYDLPVSVITVEDDNWGLLRYEKETDES